MPPVKLRDAKPVYPALAQASGVEGVVIVEATIDEDGRVADARVLRSVPLLDQAALAAVRAWRFAPTVINGRPLRVVWTTTVQFSLPRPRG
jgi:protein TonB